MRRGCGYAAAVVLAIVAGIGDARAQVGGATPGAIPTVSHGRIDRLDVPSRYVPARPVDVWLPDGYPKDAPYDVVYFHDGQMLFDAAITWNHQEWRVDEVGSALIAAGRVRPFIAVGVWNVDGRRMREYFPQKPFASLTKAQRAAQYALETSPGKPLFGGAVDSDAYLRFLVRELKPRIDRSYAVATTRAHTTIIGSSMGGLISLYALAEYPRVFGAAGCLSTHWPGSFAPDHNPLPATFFAYIDAHLPRAGTHRLYFDHGTETLDAAYASLQREVDARVAKKGYGADDLLSRAFPCDDHSERSWSGRLHVPLTFLLPPDRAASSD